MLKYFLLLSLVGCAYFVGKIDTPLVNIEAVRKNIPSLPTYCPQEMPVHFQLVGTNKSAQNSYLSMTSSQQSIKLDLFDHFALWSLIQLAVRPDQSSMTSRFQILFHHQDKSHYFDFFSESNDDQYPYLYAIEWVLRKFGKKNKLEYYAQMLDRNLNHKLTIDKDLQDFLSERLNDIRNNPELLPYFFRGTEVLQEDESTPRLSYTQIIKIYRSAEKKQQIVINTSLTPFQTKNGHKGSCNYDFNLYDNSIFLIDKVIPIANIFGLSLENSAFLASSSQKIDSIQSLHGLSLFKGSSKVRSSAVCVIEDESSKIWTISNKSRDPGQHLFHLLRYGLTTSHTTDEVDRLIRHSRHLFLSDPVRLIIESERSDSDQVENLLKLNLPIYNADKLGNIWAYTYFNQKNRFIIDDRNSGNFLCK